MLSDNVQDQFRRDRLLRVRRDLVLESFLGEIQRDRFSQKTAHGDDLRECTLKITDVGVDILRNIIQDIIVNRNGAVLALLVENGNARLIRRRLNIHGQAPAEAGAKALVEDLEILRVLIRGDHNLTAVVLHLVKCVEELLLDRFLAFDKLNIVDQKNVVRAVFFAEVLRGIAAGTNGYDQIVGKRLAGYVQNLAARIAL